MTWPCCHRPARRERAAPYRKGKAASGTQARSSRRGHGGVGKASAPGARHDTRRVQASPLASNATPLFYTHDVVVQPVQLHHVQRPPCYSPLSICGCKRAGRDGMRSTRTGQRRCHWRAWGQRRTRPTSIVLGTTCSEHRCEGGCGGSALPASVRVAGGALPAKMVPASCYTTG